MKLLKLKTTKISKTNAVFVQKHFNQPSSFKMRHQLPQVDKNYQMNNILFL